VLSRGVEEHAGFATQAARATSDAAAAYRAVLACELISATRALRLQGGVPGGALRQAFDLADSALERAAADRPLDGDLSAAEDLLPGIAGVVSWPAAAR
jgi:histidine ammonia-lyase